MGGTPPPPSSTHTGDPMTILKVYIQSIMLTLLLLVAVGSFALSVNHMSDEVSNKIVNNVLTATNSL